MGIDRHGAVGRHTLTGRELTYLLGDSGARAALVDVALREAVEAAREGTAPGQGLLPHGADGAALPLGGCLLYTSPSPRARTRSRMPSSA